MYQDHDILEDCGTLVINLTLCLHVGELVLQLHRLINVEQNFLQMACNQEDILTIVLTIVGRGVLPNCTTRLLLIWPVRSSDLVT